MGVVLLLLCKEGNNVLTLFIHIAMRFIKIDSKVQYADFASPLLQHTLNTSPSCPPLTSW